MQRFWVIFYNGIVVPIIWLFLELASFVNKKIRRGIRGRRQLFKRLEDGVVSLTATRRIWFHSASMGEFEQAKPIIAALRKQYNDIDIVVSFFSPSGYEHSRSYKLASLLTYLPLDSTSNARHFIDLIQPSAAIMVRYDVWPNYVWELASRKIPIFLVNATMRTHSSRLLPLARHFHRHVYQDLTSILTVSEKDSEAFRRFHLSRPPIQPIGDTRYDQVWHRSQKSRTKYPIPSAILQGKKILVFGSSWWEDEQVVIPAFRRIAEYDSKAMMILVPHEPNLETMERLKSTLAYKLRFIQFSNLNAYSDENVILVDNIGILPTLYRYADIAYVGGGFKQGVHNILEPAVYGIPVLYGPKHEKSQEAMELARRKGGFVVVSQQDCYAHLRRLFTDKEARVNAGKESLQLVRENIGATGRFIEHLATVI